jgi:hypothetical protein
MYFKSINIACKNGWNPCVWICTISDIPSQDEESFNDLIIKIDSKMTNKQISEKYSII